MAHLTEGTLRRMVDDPDARAGSDAAHLDGCPDCKATFDRVAGDTRSIAALLAVPDARIDVRGAYERVTHAPEAAPVLGIRFPMLTSRPRRLTFALVAAVTAAALVVVAFAASGFFAQPTTVKTVPVTLADIQALSQLADYGTVNWTTQPNFQVATSATEASQIAGGLTAPVVAQVPAGVSTTVTYGAMSQAVATFTFSASKAAAAAAAHGKTLPTIPAGMDGATLTVTVGPAVGEIYGDLKSQDPSANTINLPQLVVAKMTSPTATSTQVSLKDLESYILEQPGISQQLKDAINAIGDPSHTLLIPVPVQYASSEDITIQNNVPAVALGDNTGLGSGVVWVKGGSVYVVAGSIKKSVAEDIANNLK